MRMLGLFWVAVVISGVRSHSPRTVVDTLALRKYKSELTTIDTPDLPTGAVFLAVGLSSAGGGENRVNVVPERTPRVDRQHARTEESDTMIELIENSLQKTGQKTRQRHRLRHSSKQIRNAQPKQEPKEEVRDTMDKAMDNANVGGLSSRA